MDALLADIYLHICANFHHCTSVRLKVMTIFASFDNAIGGESIPPNCLLAKGIEIRPITARLAKSGRNGSPRSINSLRNWTRASFTAKSTEIVVCGRGKGWRWLICAVVNSVNTQNSVKTDYICSIHNGTMLFQSYLPPYFL